VVNRSSIAKRTS